MHTKVKQSEGKYSKTNQLNATQCQSADQAITPIGKSEAKVKEVESHAYNQGEQANLPEMVKLAALTEMCTNDTRDLVYQNAESGHTMSKSERRSEVGQVTGSQRAPPTLLLETLTSNVKHVTAKRQRVILPRLLDAVLKLLELVCNNQNEQVVRAFVLDFTEVS